jgi:mRNA interferase YafQ
MVSFHYTKVFKKDYQHLQKRGDDMAKLRSVLERSASRKALDEASQDHPLRGKYTGLRDRHIEPDWVSIYIIVGEELRLVRTGTHADLFKKLKFLLAQLSSKLFNPFSSGLKSCSMARQMIGRLTPKYS